MIDLLHVHKQLDAARNAYVREHPAHGCYPSVEYHIINAINFLIDEIENLARSIEELESANGSRGWVSNAGPVEIAAEDPESEHVALWRAQDHEAGDTDPDYEGEAVDTAWADYPSTDTRLGEQG